MSEVDPTQNAYRISNQSLTNLHQTVEWSNTQITQMQEIIKKLNIRIQELTKKNQDIQPNLKKK